MNISKSKILDLERVGLSQYNTSLNSEEIEIVGFLVIGSEAQ